MLSTHLSALQIIVPLVAAPLSAVFRINQLSWLLATVAGAACCAISIAILSQVLESGVIIYALGGWAAPWGIEYRIDNANAFVLLIISIIYLISVLYAKRSVEAELPPGQRTWLYTAMMLCFTGLCGITISGDVFNVFVFLEISSLSSYILISMGRRRRSLPSALRYLFMGTMAATFFLIGIGLLYALTGTLNMADLAERLPEITGRRSAIAAFGFIVVGLAIKIAIFPLHFWLPNAYTYAPSAVTAFLAGTATKAALYVLVRMMFSIFPATYYTEIPAVHTIFLSIGVLGAIVASVMAYFQTNVKRMFAYSSVAQIGYMAIGIGLATVSGVAASFLHLFNHALMKTALFMAIGGLVFKTGKMSIESLANIGRTMPWTASAILIGGLSLIGVPFTTGFISKWYLVNAALDIGMWWLAAIVLIGSLVTAAYVWKIVEITYFKRENPLITERNEAPLSMLLPAWALIIANLYFGVNATFTGSQAILAANAVLGLIP